MELPEPAVQPGELRGHAFFDSRHLYGCALTVYRLSQDEAVEVRDRHAGLFCGFSSGLREVYR